LDYSLARSLIACVIENLTEYIVTFGLIAYSLTPRMERPQDGVGGPHAGG
jgi:hypothetical protein